MNIPQRVSSFFENYELCKDDTNLRKIANGKNGNIYMLQKANLIVKKTRLTKEEIDFKKRPQIVELNMGKLLYKDILLKEYTPHIVISDGTPTTNKEQSIYMEYAEYSSLNSYLKRVKDTNLDIICQVCLFQISYTLAVIQEVYPSFRHNDLSLANILVKKASNHGYTKYNFLNKEFYVPNLGFCCLITDFDYSNINGRIDNFKVMDCYMSRPNLKISCYTDKTYDLSTFVNFMRYALHGRYSKTFSNEINGIWKECIFVSDQHLRPTKQVISPKDLLLTTGFFNMFLKKNDISKEFIFLKSNPSLKISIQIPLKIREYSHIITKVKSLISSIYCNFIFPSNDINMVLIKMSKKGKELAKKYEISSHWHHILLFILFVEHIYNLSNNNLPKDENGKFEYLPCMFELYDGLKEFYTKKECDDFMIFWFNKREWKGNL